MLRPEAWRTAAGSDLLHPQGEAQKTAQGCRHPQDLAAPFHDPAIHLHPLPGHWERPGARPAATKPPPEWEEEETLAPAPQLRNPRPRLGPRGSSGSAKAAPALGKPEAAETNPGTQGPEPGISLPSGSARARHAVLKRGGAKPIQSNPTLSREGLAAPEAPWGVVGNVRVEDWSPEYSKTWRLKKAYVSTQTGFSSCLSAFANICAYVCFLEDAAVSRAGDI